MSDTTRTVPPADRSVKITHLVFGLLFLGLAGIWALGASELVSGERLVVLAPGVLVLAGVIGLVASLASARNRGRATRPDHGPQDLPEDAYPATDTNTNTEEIR